MTDYMRRTYMDARIEQLKQKSKMKYQRKELQGNVMDKVYRHVIGDLEPIWYACYRESGYIKQRRGVPDGQTIRDLPTTLTTYVEIAKKGDIFVTGITGELVLSSLDNGDCDICTSKYFEANYIEYKE